MDGFRKLIPEQVDRYRDAGYLAPVNGLSHHEIEYYHQSFRGFLAAAGWPLDRGVQHKPHLYLKWVSDLARHPSIVDAVEDILGPDLLVWRSSFFIKGPRDSSYTAWHQDKRYWGLSSDEVVTAWIALTDSTVENGCLQVLPGSHRQGEVSHSVRPGRGNSLLRGQSADVGVPTHLVASVELKAGQFSLHHVNILHGSQSNRTGEFRAGLAVRYIPTHVRQLGPRQSATLVRGLDRFGYFDPEPIPRYDYDPVTLRTHARSVRRYAVQVVREALAEPTLAHLIMIGRIALHPRTWGFLRRGAARVAWRVAGRQPVGRGG